MIKNAIEFHTKFYNKNMYGRPREDEVIKEFIKTLKKNIAHSDLHCPMCGRNKKFYHTNILEVDVEYPFYCDYCKTSFLIVDGGNAIVAFKN